MARRGKGAAKALDAGEGGGCLVRGEPLQPIRVVKRELTRPDGSKLTVDVPVYPPFRLEDRDRPAKLTRVNGAGAAPLSKAKVEAEAQKPSEAPEK